MPKPNPVPAAPKNDDEGKGEMYSGTVPHERANEVWEYIANRLPKLKRAPGGLTEINLWLNAGADPALDIYPTIEHCLQYKSGEINSFKYFTSAISSSIYSRQESGVKVEKMKKFVELCRQDEEARS